ncbi:MAG: SMC-Scp complex subunit ScpB, partial [Bdellovibrionaceae bacterium]|nr:SMC-Scp complex subunit ScpB [Pseudobdellovibrionaceae bacterium]
MSDVEQHDEELEEKINEEFNEDELALANERSEELNAVETEVIENLDFEEVEAAFVDGTELEDFESAEVEDLEFVEQERVVSIVESLLFSTDRPQSLALIRQAFKGTSVKSKDLKNALEDLMVEYAGGKRGVTLEEVSGGYQLRTKVDNIDFLKRMVKGRSFKLSGPALEVLAITAYKQPCVKSQIDEIRGVESGHLLRGLMERGLVRFA